jgi:hypothetical protein
MKKYVILLISLISISGNNLLSQSFPGDDKSKFTSWALLQFVPSPTVFHDSKDNDARILFGFKWHIIPLSISFNPNKYVSPLQSFFVYPARRFSGSAEIFIEPELSVKEFTFSNLSIFGLSSGTRIILPLSAKGENLCFSLGGKWTYRKNYSQDKNFFYGVEAGIYAFAGMFGIQYTHNFDTKTKYNISLYIKYF